LDDANRVGSTHTLTSFCKKARGDKVVIDLAVCLPALLAGTLLGILAFRNINEVGFRRTIIVVLLLSGASLAFA
jgi:hypothetical protein